MQTTFHYDADGNLTARINGEGETELRLTYDRLHRVVSETDGEGTVTCYRYTPTGKRTAVTDGEGTLLSRTVYDLWDRPERTSDGEGTVTRYQKDRWGRITEVTKADGSTERYAYDFAGNVTTAWDALGRKTSFSYTSQGKTSGIKHADGSTEYRTYDREGRCSGKRSADGCLIEYSYNLDGNPVRITGRRPEAEELTHYLRETPEYWEAFRQFTGRARKRIRSEKTRTYRYTPDGRLAEAVGGGAAYRYTYDKNGRLHIMLTLFDRFFNFSMDKKSAFN